MKKLRLTLFDGLLLAVLVLLIAGTVVKFVVLKPTNSVSELQEITWQMKIEGVRSYTSDALLVGDTVYDNEGKEAVGVITEVAVTPAETTIYHEDGTAVIGTIEDCYDVVLTLTAQGKLTEADCEIGSYDLYVNSGSTYFTKYCIWNGTIISIG